MAKNKRGFASMDKDKQREIASKGGRASSGSFDKMDDEKHRKISQKGGRASAESRR
jgi:uncharacterized protein